MRSMYKARSIGLSLLPGLALCLLPLTTVLAAQTQHWQSFGSANDGFRALFPSEPEVSRTSVPAGNDTVELRSYGAQAGDTALYVGVCDYGAKGAAKNPEELLTNARNGAVEHSSAHILSEMKISLDPGSGVPGPGLEFEAENDKLHFTARMYMVEGVLYQAMVATPLHEKFADTARFLHSLQLLPRPRVAAPPTSTQIPDWKPYRYPSDGFIADFPFPPASQKQNVSTDAGTFELRTYVAADSSTALIVAVCDYGTGAAGKDPEALLDEARKGAVNNLKAQLVREKKIPFGAYRGVEFEADSDSAHVTARMYLVGVILYQTIVASPLDTKYADTGRFLDSFQLLGGAAN